MSLLKNVEEVVNEVNKMPRTEERVLLGQIAICLASIADDLSDLKNFYEANDYDHPIDFSRREGV